MDAIEADLGEVEDPFDNCPDCQKAHPDDGRSMSFQAGCIWADESRRDTFKGTYEYHYINVSNMVTTLDLARDCAALDCAVVGIQRYARYVALPRSESSRERERRAGVTLSWALCRGPASTTSRRVRGGLRRERDRRPLGHRHRHHQQEPAQRLGFGDSAASGADQSDRGWSTNAEITPAELAAWQTFDLQAWASESFNLAQTKGVTRSQTASG